MAPIQYPLSLSTRLVQRDLYLEDRANLESNLRQVRIACTSKSNCDGDLNICITHRKASIEEYHRYYLNPEPGRWHSDLPAYREEIQHMFERDDCTLDQVHARASLELRRHLQNDLCLPQENDDVMVQTYKKEAAEMLSSGRAVEEVLDFYLTALLATTVSSDIHDFINALQDAHTPEERIPIFIRYYCQPLSSDSKQVENFKAKYARQFQAGIPVDVVIESMRKEAEGNRTAHDRGLRNRLGELMMAQSAHMKSVARKAELKDRRAKNADSATQPIDLPCSKPDCNRRIDLEDEEYVGPIECALCDWLSHKDERRQRYPYCSKQHAEEDFENHDRQHHACISGTDCYYHPFSAPDVYSGGVCKFCEQEDKVSYFCATRCFQKNLPAHRAAVKCGKDSANFDANLELFQPDDDMAMENL